MQGEIVRPLNKISKMDANEVAGEWKQLRIDALMKNDKKASCKERTKRTKFPRSCFISKCSGRRAQRWVRSRGSLIKTGMRVTDK